MFAAITRYTPRHMRPRNVRASKVGDVLSDVLQRVDPDQQLQTYRLWTFWNDEVGDAIACRAQPSGFRNGILFVTVATHSWMQELQFLKAKIRDQLNARLGAERVRDIFFISGSIDTPPAAEEHTVDDPSPGGRPFVPLPVIADAALAEAFTRVVEARARRLRRKATSTKPHAPSRKR